MCTTYYKLLFKVRQRASSDNLITDWTYPMEDSSLSIVERQYRCKYVINVLIIIMSMWLCAERRLSRLGSLYLYS